MFKYLWIYILLGEFLLLPYVKTDWPLLNTTNIQLLGLFENILNVSTTSIESLQYQAMFKAAIILSHQYNITYQGQYIGWQSVQTNGDPMIALGNTCQFISNSTIVGIVGPAFSRESIVLAPFAGEIGIPMVSYGSTDPELSDGILYPAFYRTVPSDTTAALAFAELFIRFNWTSCIIIYQNDAFGSGGVEAISEVFNTKNLLITQTIIFDTVTLSIRGDLKSILTNSQTRIVILWADSNNTPLIIQNATDLNVLGPQFIWLLNTDIPLDNFHKTSYDKLNGILISETVPGNVVNASINTTLLNAAYQIWQQYEPQSFPGTNNVDDYALFTFDATWLLIQSLNQFCSSSSSSSCISFTGDSFCFNRRFVNSDSFLNIIDHTTFLGVSGPIQFNNNITDRVDGDYFLVKNIQYSNLTNLTYVPVLSWSDTNYWQNYGQSNVIIWPGNTLVVPTDYASVSNVTLRIALVESIPFTMMEQITGSSSKIVGYIPDLLQQIQNLMGFIPNITYFPSNQSLSELIDSVANGSFDMFVGDVTVTSARREEVAFSSSIFDNSLRIIIRSTENPTINLLSYLNPFSTKLWLVLLGSFLYAGILVCILERQENDALKDRSIISLIGMSLWYSFGTIMGRGADFETKTSPGRVLTIGLQILSLILVATYTANLTSGLTIQKSAGIISGIDDIKNGKLSYSRIAILTDSSIEDYYLREISDGSRNFYPVTTREQMFEVLINDVVDAAIMDSGISEYEINNRFCNLTLVGSEFDDSAYGIVIRKNWIYQQELDVAILSIRESNTFDDLNDKWFETKICPKSSVNTTRLSIESMTGLFVTFAIISLIALLYFAWRKRTIIKNYLIILIHGKKPLNGKDVKQTENSNEMPL